MATMNAEVYDALIAAGSPEDKARDAAAAVATNDSATAELRSDVKLLKWMVGVNIAATVGVLLKLLS